VSAVCRQLGITRQNYYARRQAQRRREVDAGLVVELVMEERKLQPRLGARKLHFLLQGILAKAGVRLGRDRFFEVLREHGLLLEPKPAAYPCTTNSHHCLPVFRNRIKNLAVSQPNEVWVGDLTYLRTAAGFLYLALLTDKSSRKVVGYHCGDTLAAGGCLAALKQAVAQLPAGAAPIHHSDQGTQYCSHEYVNWVEAHGLTVSMTEREHCAENALAERLNGILKSEYGLGSEFKTKASARVAVDQAVHLYNTRRPHTALGYRTPQAAHSLGRHQYDAAARLRSGSLTRLRSAAQRHNQPRGLAAKKPHN
jgi:transposase InsO family protein